MVRSAFILALLVLNCHGAVVLGPVIGMVTSSTARVMVEFDSTGTFKVALSTTNQTSLTQSVAVTANEPYIFAFTGLLPRTLYNVTVQGFSHVSSSFRTFPSSPTLADKLVFAVAACNRIEKTKRDVAANADAWLGLQNIVQRGEISLMLHIGDEVYSDDWHAALNGTNTLKQALAILNSRSPSEWPNLRAQLRALYRQLFIDTWTWSPTAYVLANVPNVMQADDHEYGDDLGDAASHLNTSSPEYFLFHSIRRVALLYERQLYSDVPDVHTADEPALLAQENHFFLSFGEYAIIMTDSRIARYFKPVTNDTTPFLGSSQWQEIDTFLQSQATTAKMLLFATQVPLVIFSKKVIEAAVAGGSAVGGTVNDYTNDLQGMWEYKQHHVEQLRVLNTLKLWEASSATRRATLIGGDIHILGLSEVWAEGTYDNHGAGYFRQMIVGPASGDANDRPAVRAFLDIASRLSDDIDVGWKFKHCKFRLVRNIGIIRSDPAQQEYGSLSHVIGQAPLGADTTLCDVGSMKVSGAARASFPVAAFIAAILALFFPLL
eukprot:TRINITY_DN2059_c0_g1_i1.p1 TRINITY_DN2059_c0_g1~~TRINITY_DN2059_c0_g1_i1.p1  ORF type:complete len:569 (+),score=108.39 TRINITY_DN2059_c0_g1_i1:65-1708(+)